MQFWGAYRGFLQHGSISSEVRKTFYYPRPIRKNEQSVESSTSYFLTNEKIDYDKLRSENVH